MAYIFSSIDSFSFRQKAYTSRFFTPFCGKIIIIIYFMLAIIMQNLALRWNNKNLAIGENTIWFESTSQKKAINI